MNYAYATGPIYARPISVRRVRLRSRHGPLDLPPGHDMAHARRNGPALGTEQIAIRHDARHRFQHVGAIVDEMGDAQFAAMQGFFPVAFKWAGVAAV